MGVEHHLVLSMLLIVVSGAWLLVGTMRFVMLFEVRDAFGDLASLVWSPVVKEPVVNDGSAGADTLIADLCIRGVWEAQTEALFDIRVIDTDARSYCTRSPKDVLGTAEGEKKRKYLQACQDRHATFTPLCVSVDGMLGSEAEFFVRRLGDFLAAKWERPYRLGWVRLGLTFLLLFFGLHCCVCVAVEPSGGALGHLMVPLCLLLPLINPFVYLYCYVFCVSCVLCVLWCDPVLFPNGK